MIMYNDIYFKNKKLIDKATLIMSSINDKEHDDKHMMDVVRYTKEILNLINNDNVNIDACIISSYWHDVGRLYKDIGHEELSAIMLKEEMIKLNYDDELINTCYNAIIYHRWDMTPSTLEGIIIKDADKLAFIGKNRWDECIKNNIKLDSIINLLPRLRNEILYLDISKKLYDRDIIKFKDKYKIEFNEIDNERK